MAYRQMASGSADAPEWQGSTEWRSVWSAHLAVTEMLPIPKRFGK
jgi:hypothetical protein